MSVTVKDIAEAAKVSTATVSRALNPEQTGIKPEVRKEIVELAEKMGYQKKGRKKNTENTYVGVIYKRVPSSFSQSGVLGDRLYQAIEVALFGHGKQALMHNMALSESVPAFIEDELVSGVLLVELDIDQNHPLLKKLSDLKIPAVAVNYPGTLSNFDVVSVDLLQCFQSLTKRLFDKGCKKVAFVSDDYGHYATRNSYLGYTLALLEKGMKSDDTLWLTEKDSTDIGKASAKQILKDGSIDGIICMNNIIASNVIRTLEGAGKKVPKDIKVCGYDPQPYQTDLNITAGIYDLEDITQKAVDRLDYRATHPLSNSVKVLSYCNIQKGDTD